MAGFTSLKLNLFTRLLILVLFLCAPSLPARASQKDREITETLLNEGYMLQESTVDGLLQMIDQGYSWDPTDRWMAYHNLERFYPFSEQTSLQILDRIHTAIVKKNPNVDIVRLLLGIYEQRIHSQDFYLKIKKILSLLPPSEAKRLAAVILSRFAPERAGAVQCLRSLLDRFADQPTLQIITAFNLLELDEYSEDAEAALSSNLRQPKPAELVFLYARNAFAKQVSDRLFAKLKDSLKQFAGTDLRWAELSLKEILTKRTSVEKSITDECSSELEGTVIAFPKRNFGKDF